jgi:hypothetical protein
MKAASRFRYSCLLALVLTHGGDTAVCRAQAATKALPSPVLHDGTPVYLKLARTVSSESDQAGEPVEFILKKDLVVDGTVLLAQGTSVFGSVTAARLDDRASGVGGMVEFRLAALELANGQQIPLRTIPQLPSGPNVDVKPDALVDLVNSPYGPFAHFNNGNVTTVPKEMLLTLYVAADVSIGSQPVVRASAGAQMDTISAHILHSNTGGKSLGELAREQRERGKIGGALVSGSQ